MNSPHQREQLPALLSDALSQAERARVESHLAQCPQCARELRALQAMQQTLAALPAATPPDRVRANVRATLRETARAEEKRRWPFMTWLQAPPARSLAWGGAVAVSALGLMLLAQPSLRRDEPLSSVMRPQNADAPAVSNVAPDAARTDTARKPSILADKGKKSTGKSSSTPATARPDASNDEPQLSAPPARNRRPQSTPRPPAQAPSLEPSAEIAPVAPPAPRIRTPKVRPSAPVENAPVKSATAKPSVESAGSATAATPARPAPQPRAVAPGGERFDAPLSLEQTPGATESDRASDGLTSDNADVLRKRDSEAMRSNIVPPPPASFAPPAPVAPPAPLARAGAVGATNNWPGGEVSATWKRQNNALAAPRQTPVLTRQTPVLTLSVDRAIGDARLWLLTPGGETEVWRGALNAAPVEIVLPRLTDKVQSGQEIRARLEQMDGQGHPKSSTSFDLLWP